MITLLSLAALSLWAILATAGVVARSPDGGLRTSVGVSAAEPTEVRN